MNVDVGVDVDVCIMYPQSARRN
eukprot:COSAG02_NODE_54931_length_293_cov_0.969072_1_plen_22_part_01